jgi:predicted O-methyltransferase YrrM
MNRKQAERIDKVLKRIERESSVGDRFLPIVGPEKGKFYYLTTRAVGAKRVLELGTLIGYSALLFYKAMDGKGKVVTVEYLKTHFDEAIDNFQKAGVKGMEVVHGSAQEAVHRLIAKKRKFDIVFLDIEKKEYTGIFNECLRLLDKGGILLADNASWDTRDLKAFRKMLEENEDAESVIVPIGDGISMSVKK